MMGASTLTQTGESAKSARVLALLLIRFSNLECTPQELFEDEFHLGVLPENAVDFAFIEDVLA